MPNQLSYAYASGLMYQIFFNKPMASPTGLYFGLIGVPPVNTLMAGQFGEVGNNGIGTNYVREPAGVSNGTGVGAWTYYLYGSGAVYNTSTIQWPVTSQDWGWASGIALFDCALPSSGNMVFYGTLTTPQELSLNSQFYIPPSGAFVRMS